MHGARGVMGIPFVVRNHANRRAGAVQLAEQLLARVNAPSYRPVRVATLAEFTER
jgi:hypothetical protein